MADTTKPSDRSAEAAKVADATVPDAPKRGPGRPPNARPADAPENRLGPAERRDPSSQTGDNDRMTSSNHPLSREPIERVQHADRATDEQTTNRPSPLSTKDLARLEELRSKRPNPNVLPPDVRTEDEEMEFRKLSKADSDATRASALEAARPDLRPNPRQRLEALKAKGGQNLGEGEAIEVRRIEELIADEARIEELKKMDRHTDEEQAELEMLQARATEARASGGFDPNG